MNYELEFDNKKFWIFQSNVKNDYGFDIRESCGIRDRIEVWPIRRHYQHVRQDDHCFIWACGLGDVDSGIYCIGRVVREAFAAEDELYPEYRHGFGYPGKGFEVLVQYTHPLAEHISRKVFKEDPPVLS